MQIKIPILLASKIPALFFLLIISFSCTNPKNEIPDERKYANRRQSDDISFISKQLICGLWSVDSGNILTNEGYYFTSDGTLGFIASEFTGSWELVGNDTLKIKYNNYVKDIEMPFKIDSLSESRLVMHDQSDTIVFRKVPFGMNPEENVLSGFSGSLSPGQEKVYTVELPSVKKIGLKLTSGNENVKFLLYDGEKEIGSSVMEWTSIIIRGGKYKIKLIFPKSDTKDDADYDLKVYTF